MIDIALKFNMLLHVFLGSTTTTTESPVEAWRKAKYYAQGIFVARSSHLELTLSNKILLITFYFSMFISFM